MVTGGRDELRSSGLQLNDTVTANSGTNFHHKGQLSSEGMAIGFMAIVSLSQPACDFICLCTGLPVSPTESIIEMTRTAAIMLTTVVALTYFISIDTSHGASDAEFNNFVRGCVNGCAKNPEHREICNRQCTCMATTLREDRGIKSFKNLNLSKSEVQSLDLICSGEVGVSIMIETCNKNCKSDQACLKLCKCVSEKIRENRTPEEVGKVFNSLSANSAAIEELRNACHTP